MRPRAARRLRVAVTDAHGRPVRRFGLARWLEQAAPRRARGIVTIALISDRNMRRLNARFRHQDKAADVLSFPDSARLAGQRSGPAGQTRTQIKGPAHLGDVAVAMGVAARQARRLGHSLREEVRILALHGLLHLMGYDHETDSGTMRRLEEGLRQRAGLPSGLVSRAGRNLFEIDR